MSTPAKALCVAVAARMGSADVLEALYPLLLAARQAGVHSIRQWSGVRCCAVAGMADARRHQTHPDLSGLTLGEWLQRTLQRNAAPRGAQRRVVHNDRTGPDRHQPVAQAVQSHPAASGAQHATAGAGNSNQEMAHKHGGWTPYLHRQQGCCVRRRVRRCVEAWHISLDLAVSEDKANSTSPTRSTHCILNHVIREV